VPLGVPTAGQAENQGAGCRHMRDAWVGEGSAAGEQRSWWSRSSGQPPRVGAGHGAERAAGRWQPGSAETGQGAQLTRATAQPSLCWAMRKPRASGQEPAQHCTSLPWARGLGLGKLSGDGTASGREQKQAPSVVSSAEGCCW